MSFLYVDIFDSIFGALNLGFFLYFTYNSTAFYCCKRTRTTRSRLIISSTQSFIFLNDFFYRRRFFFTISAIPRTDLLSLKYFIIKSFKSFESSLPRGAITFVLVLFLFRIMIHFLEFIILHPNFN